MWTQHLSLSVQGRFFHGENQPETCNSADDKAFMICVWLKSELNHILTKQQKKVIYINSILGFN